MQVDDNTVAGAIVTFILGALGLSAKRLRTDIDRAHDRLNSLPEEYVMKDDYREDTKELKDALVRLDTKLDTLISTHNGEK